MSHTVKVDLQIKNLQAVESACKDLGLEVLGNGTHRLYGSQEKGFGFKLKGWSYPVIVKEDGSVSYDNYNGSWGNIQELRDFQDAYSVACVKSICQQNSWYHELNPVSGELIIHHPSGGTVTVGKGGMIDASGFVGVACTEATAAIEQALGKRLEETVKPEMRLTSNIVKEVE